MRGEEKEWPVKCGGTDVGGQPGRGLAQADVGGVASEPMPTSARCGCGGD